MVNILLCNSWCMVSVFLFAFRKDQSKGLYMVLVPEYCTKLCAVHRTGLSKLN